MAACAHFMSACREQRMSGTRNFWQQWSTHFPKDAAPKFVASANGKLNFMGKLLFLREILSNWHSAWCLIKNLNSLRRLENYNWYWRLFGFSLLQAKNLKPGSEVPCFSTTI